MKSALQHPVVVDDYLARECGEGRLIGPLVPEECGAVMTSSFGVIPKGNTGKWRVIVDLSALEGASVNDAISPELCSLTYCGVEEASKELARLGQGTVMAKIDIKSAYQVVPVHPDDRWLLGLKWKGALYVDTTLAFGLRSAPKIFTAIADAAQWIIERAEVRFIMHYLDDFLLVGAPHSRECREGVRTVLQIFNRLGLPVAEEKLEGPDVQLTFLGLELDSDAMVIRLPEGKLMELKALVQQWLGRKSCKRKDLESLVGKLGHACKVVQPGKTFLR